MHRFVKQTRCWQQGLCSVCWRNQRLIPLTEGMHLKYLCRECALRDIKPCFEKLWEQAMLGNIGVGERTNLVHSIQAWNHFRKGFEHRYFQTPEEVKQETGYSLEASVMLQLDPIRGILRILDEKEKDFAKKRGYKEWVQPLLSYMAGENFK